MIGMKELITAAKVREIAKSGGSVLEYSRQNSLVTPEAYDVARELKIELKATDYRVTKKIYRKFCGIRPNFSISDRDLLVFQVKEAIQKQLPNVSIDDETLVAMIERLLDEE